MDTQKVFDNRKRSKTTVGLLIAYIILSVLTLIILSLFPIDYPESYYENLGSSETLIGIIGAFALILMGFGVVVIQIILTVFFIMWFRRAYANLHRLGLKYLNSTEGMAAGCWFIPIINFYLPYNIMKETWQRTTRLVKDMNIELPANTTDIAIVGWWWSLWIGSRVVAIFTGNSLASTFSKDETDIFSMGDFIFYGSDIAAAVLAIMVIKRFSKIEDELFNHQDKIVLPTIEPTYSGRERDPYFSRNN